MAATLFGFLVLTLAATLLVDRHFRRRRAALIGGLGRPALMHHASVDRFGLSERLLAEPEWTRVAPDLEVKDVLYAAAGMERCFIFTAKSRRSHDAPGVRCVVRLIEKISAGQDAELSILPSDRANTDADAYRHHIDHWLGRCQNDVRRFNVKM